MACDSCKEEEEEEEEKKDNLSVALLKEKKKMNLPANLTKRLPIIISSKRTGIKPNRPDLLKDFFSFPRTLQYVMSRIHDSSLKYHALILPKRGKN